MQNSNESFNSRVWSIAPKSKSNGKIIVNIACHLVVSIFNDGFTSILKIMQVMNLTIGRAPCQIFGALTHRERKKASEDLPNHPEKKKTRKISI